MIRGHRIDSVYMTFFVSRPMAPCHEINDLVNFRDMIKLLFLLRMRHTHYTTAQAWFETLGFALITGVPSGPNEHDHPFQRYLDQRAMKTRLSNAKLMQIWKTYRDEFLSDSGTIWSEFRSCLLSRYTKQGKLKTGGNFEFDPIKQLTHDQQLAWLLHKYLGDVLQRHCFIVTQRGYMGLAPPNTIPGDVVVVLGGPGTAVVIRNLSVAVFARLEVLPYSEKLETACGAHTRVVPSVVGTPMNELKGPCYLQGFMDGEMYKDWEHDEKFEWETDRLERFLSRRSVWCNHARDVSYRQLLHNQFSSIEHRHQTSSWLHSRVRRPLFPV
jgi:hypothetical protein